MVMQLITITITFVFTRDKYKLYALTAGVQLYRTRGNFDNDQP